MFLSEVQRRLVGISGIITGQDERAMFHYTHEGSFGRVPLDTRRKVLMQRMEDFCHSNWNGLLSNCSSFARYLHTGEKVALGSRQGHTGFYRWRRPMYPYRGGYIAVGDVVLVIYCNKRLLNYVKNDTAVRLNDISDTRLARADESPDTLRYIGNSQKKDGRLFSVSVKQQIDLVSSMITDDYHFLVCVGYRDFGGIAKPIFVSQRGHNDKRKNSILIEPPFGVIGLTAFEPFARRMGGSPLGVFLSRPDTLPHPW